MKNVPSLSLSSSLLLFLTSSTSATAAQPQHQQDHTRQSRRKQRQRAQQDEQSSPQQDLSITAEDPESRRRRQHLAFINKGQPLEGSDGSPYYALGQNVNISWTTPFARTSLNVFQRRQSGGFVMSTIAEGFPRDTTSVIWQAQTLTTDGVNDAFHFQLVNARNSQCNACSQNSNSFAVSQRSSASSSSSSTSPTSSPTSTHSMASMHTTAGGAGGSQMSTTSTSSSSTGTSSPSSSSSASNADSARNLGVGLGVGLGVPALALLGIFLFFFLRSRNNKKRSAYYRDISRPIPSDEHNMGDDGMTTSTSAMALRDSPNPALVGDGDGDPSSMAPPRPSYAGGMSEFGGAGGSTHSDQSWFEPFDFERPVPERTDQRDEAMSQLRQSLNSRGSIRPSSDGLSLSNPGTSAGPAGPELPPHALTTDEAGRI